MADTTWGSEVYRYYGATPYWDEYDEIKTRTAAAGCSHAREGNQAAGAKG